MFAGAGVRLDTWKNPQVLRHRQNPVDGVWSLEHVLNFSKPGRPGPHCLGKEHPGASRRCDVLSVTQDVFL